MATMDTAQAPEEANQNTILAVCEKHLKDDDWKYDLYNDDGLTYIVSGAKGINGSYRVILDAREERSLLVIYVKSHISCPFSNRRDVANYLTRANFGLVIGNFELDMSDGEVRFKCSTTLAGSSLSTEMVSNMLGTCLITMDRYHANLIKVAYGVLTPEVAYRQSHAGLEYVTEVAREIIEDSGGTHSDSQQNGGEAAQAADRVVEA